MASKVKQSQMPPHGYEFGGPLGATAIVLLLPVLLWAMAFLCNDVSGCPATPLILMDPKTLTLEALKASVGWPEDGIWGLGSWKATGALLGYYLFSAILYRVLPAEEVEGTVLANGKRLKYRLNSFYSQTVVFAIAIAGTIAQGADFPLWTFMTDNYVQLLTASIGVSYVMAIFVYVRSFSVPAPGTSDSLRELAAGGHTGNLIYDFYIGRELNPRITLPWFGEFDIKEWCELRPGMLGWILWNCAFTAKQYRTFGYVTDSIVFITIVQAVYVIDSQIMESAILTTIDITTDGFGFMLSFGDLVWVPFLYSTQTRYLSMHPVSLGWMGTAGVAAVLSVGFSIFRLSNSQKNTFRTNPDHPSVKHLKYIQTKTGSKLITSGWWGVARHINYLGDWLQAWPYSLPTGFAGYMILAAGTGAEGAYVMADGREVIQGAAKGFGMVFTYFYVIYFAVLLIHRDGRDWKKCHDKYGEDWEKYCKIVKYSIIPGIY